ncbi:hypothetical protein BDN72DRAFT_854316 [Pluteus cervinus]|uniref:Uncharacterized protein n=1 Tax=Pluteus cervinus TaxID=181527 RepID=A0ACD3B981_9AGAR|nr:hypothetical protein BDN72DRAFT_854316 [Pluteus cervinus]
MQKKKIVPTIVNLARNVPSFSFRAFNRRPSFENNVFVNMQNEWGRDSDYADPGNHHGQDQPMDPNVLNALFMGNEDEARKLREMQMDHIHSMLFDQHGGLYRYNSIFTGFTGHQYVNAQAVEFSDPRRRVEDPSLMVLHWMSIPGFRFLLPPDHHLVPIITNPELSRAQREDLITEHREELVKETKEFLARAKERTFIPEGSVAALGDSYVSLHRHQVETSQNGNIGQSITASTLPPHHLDGSADHSYVFNPTHQDVLVAKYSGLGAHLGYLVDRVNPYISQALWEAVSDATAARFEHMEKGSPEESFLNYVHQTDLELHSHLVAMTAIMDSKVIGCAGLGYKWLFGANVYTLNPVDHGQPGSDMTFSDDALSRPFHETRRVPNDPQHGNPILTITGSDGGYRGVNHHNFFSSPPGWEKDPQNASGLTIFDRPIDPIGQIIPQSPLHKRGLWVSHPEVAKTLDSLLKKYIASALNRDAVLALQKQQSDAISKHGRDMMPDREVPMNPNRAVEILASNPIAHMAIHLKLNDAVKKIIPQLMDEVLEEHNVDLELLKEAIPARFQDIVYPHFFQHGGFWDMWANIVLQDRFHEVIENGSVRDRLEETKQQMKTQETRSKAKLEATRSAKEQVKKHEHEGLEREEKRLEQEIKEIQNDLVEMDHRVQDHEVISKDLHKNVEDRFFEFSKMAHHQ